MLSIKRRLRLKQSPQLIFKKIVSILVGMNAQIEHVSENYISAIHGSYSAFHPKNIKKDIKITLKKAYDNASDIELNITYTSYITLLILITTAYLIVGTLLFHQAHSSLNYLDLAERYPFIALIEEPPWLLQVLISITSDASTLELFLITAEIISVILLITGAVEIVYIILIPISVRSFAEELVARITSSVTEADDAEHREPVSGDQNENMINKFNVECYLKSENTILCNVKGDGLSREVITKVLEFMGFAVSESPTGVIMGEKPGSYFADKFLSKKMRARTITSPDGKASMIMFETSIWIGFSERDRLDAESILKNILRSQIK